MNPIAKKILKWISYIILLVLLIVLLSWEVRTIYNRFVDQTFTINDQQIQITNLSEKVDELDLSLTKSYGRINSLDLQVKELQNLEKMLPIEKKEEE